ncbi:hypothetical protein MKW94_007771 [Papaver nudicaule]|uniref:Uncharacterized protein n=1 Tax=Papaver nudicaule TaxID=74823 RepID=A0AA41RVT0_PAPNU|nr:hypothetical protein [Papaver nudicaule]
MFALLTGTKSSSSNTMVDPELFRRFTPGGTLPRIPNADFLSIKEVREMFNIPKSVKISKMEKLTDPVGEDEVVVNLYQLACGFPMPIDSFTCALLTAWGITIPQVHPSLCLALRRIEHQDSIPTIPADNIIERGPIDEHDEHESDKRIQHFFNLPRSLFDVSLHEIYVECSYDRDLNAKVSLPVHASPLARRPGITIIDSDSESDECNPPKAKNLSASQCSEESSPIRFPRRPLASSRHCAKRSLVNGVFNSKNVPDAMSGKVCTPLRRSNRANNKVRYTYSDPTFDDSASDFVVPLRKKTVRVAFSNHVDSSVIQSRLPPSLLKSGPKCGFPDVLRIRQKIVELRTKVDELTNINKNQKKQIASCRQDLDASSLERTESRKRISELELLLHIRTDELSQTREELQLCKSRALNLYQIKNAFNAAFNDNGFDPTQ